MARTKEASETVTQLETDPTEMDIPAGTVCLATLNTFQQGRPMFSVDGVEGLLRPVATVCEVGPSQIGQLFAVTFDRGDRRRPIVIGAVRQIDQSGSMLPLVIESDQEIRLQCGAATIKLSADGTVAIRGKNVASRAAHTNRIRGGNVQIN